MPPKQIVGVAVLLMTMVATALAVKVSGPGNVTDENGSVIATYSTEDAGDTFSLHDPGPPAEIEEFSYNSSLDRYENSRGWFRCAVESEGVWNYKFWEDGQLTGEGQLIKI